MIGRLVNRRYRITRLIDKGGMGAVFQALDTKLDRTVAIKFIVGDVAKVSSLTDRFLREQKAAASIDSPYIAMMLDAGNDDESGAPFMVMEYLEGEDLRGVLQRLVYLPPPVVLRIAAQACRGLVRVHEARIIHRDIKPGNLFLASRKGEDTVRAKLLDFGVAKLRMDLGEQGEVGDPTRTGIMIGSPRYMAPEQARGSKAIDHRADIWSLGVVMYQALAGRTPSHDCEALAEILIATCTEPPQPIQEIAPWVSPEIAAIVHGALRLSPDERFQSAEQMLDAILPLLPGGPDGTEINTGMLVAVSKEERAHVSPSKGAPPSVLSRSVTPVQNRVAPASQRGSTRILLIEDNEMNMDMLSRRLRKKGYEVLCAVDGETGVAMGRSERPALILMDVGLPGMDGWEATQQLRASPETRNIPIIALTAHATGPDREKALEVGCDDYETKPVEFTRLLGKIEALLAARNR
jgi:serine/threonine protein kinase